MEELISERTFNSLITVIAVIGPILGLIIGIVVGVIKNDVKRLTIRGVIIGSFALITYIMWRIYNAITDHYGLDSVKNLLINLGLFTLVGIIIGLLLAVIQNKFSIFGSHTSEEKVKDRN